MARPGVRQKGLDNMKQISTGAGLVALSVGMVATAFVATHRSGGEAFAQVTSGDRRIVAQGVYAASTQNGYPGHWGYRVWSDNVTEVKWLGQSHMSVAETGFRHDLFSANGYYSGSWQVVDAGTSAFYAGDVDRSGQVDAGDVSAVLLDFGNSSDETPPPPIDCNINAPR